MADLINDAYRWTVMKAQPDCRYTPTVKQFQKHSLRAYFLLLDDRSRFRAREFHFLRYPDIRFDLGGFYLTRTTAWAVITDYREGAIRTAA